MNDPIPAVDLARDRMLADARAVDGLDDFGDDSFLEPLTVLLQDLEEHARLNPAGRYGQRERIVNLLVNRLRTEDLIRRYPAIEEEVIAEPLVIVGLPRTGTTMLHRSLASDDRFFAPLWYEVRHPAPFPDWDFDSPDPRIDAAEAEVAMMLEANPELAAIHPLEATGADEEIMLLEHSFYSTMPPAFANVPNYLDWLGTHDNTPGYRYLYRLLQSLQWQKKRRGGEAERWLLKTPHHLHCMPELFRVFPDARVIQTHRDPLQTIPSIASFNYELWKLVSDDVDPVRVGEQWAAKFARGMRDTLAFRDAHPDAAFLDVWFDDTLNHPLDVMRQVYEFAGIPLTDRARAGIEEWRDANRREVRPPHHYTLEAFGFTEAGITEQFKDYRERYILPPRNGGA